MDLYKLIDELSVPVFVILVLCFALAWRWLKHKELMAGVSKSWPVDEEEE